MLVHERPAVLRVAAQAKLIDISHPQVVSGGAAVRVMAIHARHFPFPQRVVVGQAHLGPLGRMALQAGIVGRPAWFERPGVFRHEFLDERDSAGGGGVETYARLSHRLGLEVDFVAVRASNTVCRVRPCEPVADFLILGVAAQASATWV